LETNDTVHQTHQFDLYSAAPSLCTICGETVKDAANVPGNPWYGKNWVALGTSLTSEAQGTYVMPLAERTGLTVTNYGIPGGTAVKEILSSAQTANLSQADLITIEFGINDWYAHIPLGSVGDTVPYSVEIPEGSFAGACYQIFTTLQKRAPQALIVFLTEPTGQTFDATGENCSAEKKNLEGRFQQDYIQTAADVAAFTGIPVIDAGSRSMINQHHPAYLEDQIHHSNLGGQQYALTVWLELKNMAPLLKEE
jgi:lysophospholipase L1-like esterase